MLVGLLVLIALAGGVLASLSAARIRDNDMSSRAQLLERTQLAVGTVVSAATAALHGADTITGTDGRIDRFATFADDLVERSALSTIGMVEVVQDVDRSEVEQRLARPIFGLLEGGLVPAPEQASYVVLTEVVPANSSFEPFIGFDVSTEPTLAATLSEAASGTSIGLSTPLVGVDGIPTIVLAIAVREPATENLVGFVLSFVDAADLLADLRTLVGPGTRIQITDGESTVAASHPLASSLPSKEVQVGGRVWTIRVDDGSEPSYLVPLLIAVATLLLVSSVGVIAIQRSRAQHQMLDDANIALAMARLVGQLARASSDADVSAGVAEHVPRATGAHSARLVPNGHQGVDTPANMVLDPGEVVRGLVRRHASATIPMLSDGLSVGRLELEWKGTTPFDLEERSRLATIATITSQVVQRVHLTETEHRVVEGLKQLTLEVPTELPGLDLAVAYRSAIEGLALGGDWYDIVEQSDNRVSFVIGDVAGHDIDAVVEMTEVRTVLRTLLGVGLAPSTCMAIADEILSARSGVRMATAIVGVIDVEQDSLVFLNAGHPPLILRAPDGSATPLTDGRRSVLGFGLGSEVADVSVPFPEGSVVVGYTDGLVERRDAPLDDGIGRLVKSVAALPTDSSANDVCEQVLADLLEESLQDGLHDDVATVTIRRTPAT